MPDMFLICICQLCLEIDARKETKSKGGHSEAVAQRVITLSRGPFSSLEMAVSISDDAIYLLENKTPLCPAVHFLERVQATIPSTVKPWPLFASLKTLRTSQVIFTRRSSVSGCVRKVARIS